MTFEGNELASPPPSIGAVFGSWIWPLDFLDYFLPKFLSVSKVWPHYPQLPLHLCPSGWSMRPPFHHLTLSGRKCLPFPKLGGGDRKNAKKVSLAQSHKVMTKLRQKHQPSFCHRPFLEPSLGDWGSFSPTPKEMDVLRNCLCLCKAHLLGT